MTARAASAWAKTPPPISRASFPVNQTVAAPASGGQQAQAEERFAEKMPRDPGDEGDQRRLIDVAEVEVLGAGEIIQLVAKDSVAAGGEEMKKELRDSQQQHDGRAGEKTMGHGRAGARQVNCPFHLVVRVL